VGAHALEGQDSEVVDVHLDGDAAGRRVCDGGSGDEYAAEGVAGGERGRGSWWLSCRDCIYCNAFRNMFV
jgi:hypothetical protein